MKIISHRGNLMGKSDYENDPKQIKACLSLGIDCEIDLWIKDNRYWLGHDEPIYEVKRSFLQQAGLWIHCKNLNALQNVPSKSNYFWHQTDDFTLTSKGYIWTFPKKKLVPGSFCVMPEYGYTGDISLCMGICSDFIQDYK